MPACSRGTWPTMGINSYMKQLQYMTLHPVAVYRQGWPVVLSMDIKITPDFNVLCLTWMRNHFTCHPCIKQMLYNNATVVAHNVKSVRNTTYWMLLYWNVNTNHYSFSSSFVFQIVFKWKLHLAEVLTLMWLDSRSH